MAVNSGQWGSLSWLSLCSLQKKRTVHGGKKRKVPPFYSTNSFSLVLDFVALSFYGWQAQRHALSVGLQWVPPGISSWGQPWQQGATACRAGRSVVGWRLGKGGEHWENTAVSPAGNTRLCCHVWELWLLLFVWSFSAVFLSKLHICFLFILYLIHVFHDLTPGNELSGYASVLLWYRSLHWLNTPISY